ncbi:hypothetical protein, partial [Pseudomonas putida]|uniref:hypothetical protein n=1 Tax=Pseudomonas putida TaxID=303 RepID=UPI001F524E68
MNHLIRPSFSALNTLEKLDRQQSIYTDRGGFWGFVRTRGWLGQGWRAGLRGVKTKKAHLSVSLF